MPPRRKKADYKPYFLSAIVIVAFFLAWGPVKKYFFDKRPVVTPPAIVQIDPICQYVENYKLHCLSAPSPEGLMGPGHYVKYTATATDTKVPPLGEGNLFESVCIVSGVKEKEAVSALMTELKNQEQTNKIPLDQITYKLDKAFKAGADLPIPRLAELELKAGPKMTEVQDISLKAPNAWVKVIDENRFIDILSQAAIKDTCIDQLIRQKYSVVSKAAIAQDYDIVVKEKAGQEFSLSAAVKKGDLQMNGGGDASSSLDETIKKSSSTPVVLGVAFFDSDIISRNRAKLVAPVFSATAQTKATAAASGQGRVFWKTERAATLGEHLPLEQRGGGEGSGRCGGGVPSTVQLNSVVAVATTVPESLDGRAFEFSTIGMISGGLSRLERQGPFGIFQGCDDQPANVEAQVSFESNIKTIVRSDTASTMQVQFANVPSAAAEVRAWNGQMLQQQRSEVPAGPDTQNFKLVGAGVYNVHISGSRALTQNGPQTREVSERGTFTITVR